MTDPESLIQAHLEVEARDTNAPLRGIPTDFEFNKLARRCYDQDKEIQQLRAELDKSRRLLAEAKHALAQKHEAGRHYLSQSFDIVADLVAENERLKQEVAESRRLLAEQGEWEDVPAKTRIVSDGFGDVAFVTSNRLGTNDPTVVHIYKRVMGEWVNIALWIAPDDMRLQRRTSGATSGGQDE